MLKYQVIIRDYIDIAMIYTRYGSNHRINGHAVLWEDGEVFHWEYGKSVEN